MTGRIPHLINNRFARFLVPAVLALTVTLSVLSRIQPDGNADSIAQWLPLDMPEGRQYAWFREHFGSDELAVVSWVGCTLDDPRLDALASELRTSSAAHSFRTVVTGSELVQRMTEPPLELPESEVRERLSGVLIGPDRETTALVVTLSDAGAADREVALAELRSAADSVSGLSSADLKMGGPTVDAVALEEESRRSKLLLNCCSMLLATLLAWKCLKQWRLVVMVFLTAVVCRELALAAAVLTGAPMNLVLGMMPTLIYVLSISTGIHLANYYRTALKSHCPRTAPGEVLKSAWRPCALAAMTTAVGLLSLAVSDVQPVRNFGLYCAIGMMISLPILFVFLPSLMQLFPLPANTDRREKPAAPHSLSDPHWSNPISRVLGRHHTPVLATCIVLMIVCGVGVARIETSVKLMNMFASRSRIIQDYAWLEKNLGPLVPIEVVVQFPKEDGQRTIERLDIVRELAAEVDSMESIDGVLCATTLSAPLPSQGGGFGGLVARRVADRRLQDYKEAYRAAGYLAESGDVELWRISARVEALNSLDYGQLVDTLRNRLEPRLRELNREDGIEVSAVYTGLVPVVYKAQRELLGDLAGSFLSAFVLVALAMMLMLQGVSAGLVSMLPNLFPAVLIFGSLGWAGVLVDIGAMMTASLALGIAVDDTIHFLSWFRRSLAMGNSRPDAVAAAYRHCGGAMLQTTIVCGLGLLVFTLSTFMPAARFSWLLFSLLGTALIGDLIFLPALLISPLGRFFEPGSERFWQRMGNRLQASRLFAGLR